MTPDRLDALLSDLRQRLRALYGKRLTRLVLYGSHARGDALEDSDVDVLVVLEGEVRPFEEIERMNAVVFEAELRHGALVSTVPTSLASLSSPTTALLRNIAAEGQDV